MSDVPKIARIGVTVPAARDGHVLPGRMAAIYDLDTKVLLPAEAFDLHIGPEEIVTAKVTLLISEIIVGTLPWEAPADGR